MQAELLDSSAILYARPAMNAQVLQEIVQGAEFSLEPLEGATQAWYKVDLSRGRSGYLPATTTLLWYHPITLTADSDVYAEPHHTAPIAYRYARDSSLLDITGPHDTHGWRRVRDGGGEIGYLPPDFHSIDTTVLTAQQRADAKTLKKAKDRMLSGGLLFFGSVFISLLSFHYADIATREAINAGATPHYHYFYPWITAIYGGIRFVQGFCGWLAYGVDDPEDGSAEA